MHAVAAARAEFGFCQHAASRALALLEREGGQSLSGLAAACSNSTWMEWRVGAALMGAAEECLSWGAASRTGAPNSTATPQDGHTGAPRRFLPALHNWVVAEAVRAPTSAAATLQLEQCDRCSPELRPRCVCTRAFGASLGRSSWHHTPLKGGWLAQGGGGDAVPGQSTRYRGSHPGVGVRRAQTLLPRQGLLPLSGVFDGARRLRRRKLLAEPRARTRRRSFLGENGLSSRNYDAGAAESRDERHPRIVLATTERAAHPCQGGGGFPRWDAVE
jgi:hypothetical protein